MNVWNIKVSHGHLSEEERVALDKVPILIEFENFYFQSPID